MTNSGREQLNEYLEKPLALDDNQLSTAVSLSSTALSSGGLSGEFVIRKGNLVIKDGGGVIIEDGGFLRMFDTGSELSVSLEFE